jgi:tyrosyl-tRNA synthetase
MSKSLGNTIGLQDAPNDMFGKVMSLPDQALDLYARLVTNLHPTEVNILLKNIEEKKVSPIEAKKKVAAEVVTLIYSLDEAIAAEKYFENTFQKKQEPVDDAPEYTLPEDKRLISVIMESMNYSGGEARRMVNQGAVKINDQKAQDINHILSDGDFIKIGRHTFLRIREN